MILVDTSVWVDHLRQGNPLLVEFLDKSDVLMHPWVVGELALGNIRNRVEVLQLLAALLQIAVVNHSDVLQFISDERIYGLGVGLVDAQLLASARTTPGTAIWTRDRQLAGIAGRLGVHFA